MMIMTVNLIRHYDVPVIRFLHSRFNVPHIIYHMICLNLQGKFHIHRCLFLADSVHTDWANRSLPIRGTHGWVARGNQEAIPDSKVHGAHMGPTWVLSAPNGPHVGPMNLAIRDAVYNADTPHKIYGFGPLDEITCPFLNFDGSTVEVWNG